MSVDSFTQLVEGKEVRFSSWFMPTTDYRFTKMLPPEKSSLTRQEYFQYVKSARQQMVRPTHWPIPEDIATAYGESFFQTNARFHKFIKKQQPFYVPFQSMHEFVTESNHILSFIYSPDQWDSFKKRKLLQPKVPACCYKAVVDVKTQYLEHPDGSFPGTDRWRWSWPGKPCLSRNIAKPKWMLWLQKTVLGKVNPSPTLVGPQTDIRLPKVDMM